MAFKIVDFLTQHNFTDKNSTSRIKYIVIHYFGSLGTAKDVANYFASAYRGASAHFSLDEGETVYRCVKEEDIAWHCGTSGKYVHPTCRNSNSLGIEVRPYKVDTSRATYASDRDWYFTDAIIDRLVEFTVYLMKKYNVPPENVIRHYDVTGKWCPRPMMGTDTNTVYNDTGDNQWKLFKQKLEVAYKTTNPQPSTDKVTETAYKAEGTVTASSLNVRTGPSTDYAKVSSLSSGAKVSITHKTSNGWYKLSTGKYVSGSYIKITAEKPKEGDDGDMAKLTQEEFNTMMNVWIETQANRTDTWFSEEVRKFVEDNGIINGDTNGRKMYKKFVTREEIAVIIYRTCQVLIDLIKKSLK